MVQVLDLRGAFAGFPLFVSFLTILSQFLLALQAACLHIVTSLHFLFRLLAVSFDSFCLHFIFNLVNWLLSG